MIADRVLRVIEDIPGVVGSFVTSPDGELLLMSMPAGFDFDGLRLTASRITRVLTCGNANGVCPEESVFDFGGAKLLVRRFVQGHLCVLAQSSVDMRSLRLTARLVARGMPPNLPSLPPPHFTPAG